VSVKVKATVKVMAMATEKDLLRHQDSGRK
jgi:hypothetical protein